MATLVCAPFSKWRHTPKSLAAILKMAVVRRHFENGPQIVAAAGAPLTESRRGDFFRAISQMAAFGGHWKNGNALLSPKAPLTKWQRLT